ncbi:hypothetical protein [Dethiosulfovibrio salsuginis]|uniref:Uncharacterized protein n=1 Tax=Dethiosulfovibrio salsuginis TaxID=561720 RepID=A0A1X7IBE1_9BACT|nr:hypothetical protein [Dethiosulfovibrio salsuginis]SMG11937.1 hypothetical protein SAMN06275492_101306 [Dethiosulfovibrio salsuginis]
MPSKKFFDSEFVKQIGKQMMKKDPVVLSLSINRTDQQIKDDFRRASLSLRSADGEFLSLPGSTE